MTHRKLLIPLAILACGVLIVSLRLGRHGDGQDSPTVPVRAAFTPIPAVWNGPALMAQARPQQGSPRRPGKAAQEEKKKKEQSAASKTQAEPVDVLPEGVAILSFGDSYDDFASVAYWYEEPAEEQNR